MINMEDLEINVYPKNNSGFSLKIPDGIQILHKPTGVSIICTSERSQHKNRAIALKLLEEKLNE